MLSDNITFKKEMVDEKKTMNSDMHEILNFIKSKTMIIYGGNHTKFTDIHQIFKHLYDQDKKEFPFTDTKKLYKAFIEYPEWKHGMLFDLDTKYKKVSISFSKEVVKNAKDWWKNNKERKQKSETMNKEFFDNIPILQIPENKITYNDHNKKVRSYKEMINREIKDALAIIMSPGGGKTEECIDYTKNLDIEMNGQLRTLIPCFRIALCAKICDDFKSLNIKHYSDIKDHFIYMSEVLKLVVQIDSFHRVVDEIKDGVLILDEIESIIEHILTSPHIKEQTKIINRLVTYIRNAKTVIVMDANLSETTISFLQDICGLSLKIYRNTFVRNERPLFFLRGKGATIKKIIELLRAGKNVYVPTNSSKFGDYLLEKLKEAFPNDEKTFKKYDKHTKINVGEGDPIKDTVNYNCAIVTPKFRAGNSVTDPHFDNICGYFTGASCSAGGASQLIMRVRAVVDPSLYLYVDNRLGKGRKAHQEIKSFNDMKTHMMEKEFTRHNKHEFILSNGDLHHFEFDILGRLNLNDPSTFLFIANKYHENESYKIIPTV